MNGNSEVHLELTGQKGVVGNERRGSGRVVGNPKITILLGLISEWSVTRTKSVRAEDAGNTDKPKVALYCGKMAECKYRSRTSGLQVSMDEAEITDWGAWSREAVRLMQERNDSWQQRFGLSGCPSCSRNVVEMALKKAGLNVKSFKNVIEHLSKPPRKYPHSTAS